MSNLTDWMGKCHELEAENERLKNQNTLLKVFESEEAARLKAWNQERAGQFAATEQRLATEFATLRGIIARSTIQRISDGVAFHVTLDDINTSLEITAQYKEQNNLP